MPPRAAATKPDDRPPYFLWVFDPTDGDVRVTHNQGRPPANALTHLTMAPDVVHPERLQGYAYPIKDGWRLTNDEHKKLEDPFVIRVVLKALNRQYTKPLPCHTFTIMGTQVGQALDFQPGDRFGRLTVIEYAGSNSTTVVVASPSANVGKASRTSA